MKNPFFNGAGRREAGVAVGRSAWRARNGRAGHVAAGSARYFIK